MDVESKAILFDLSSEVGIAVDAGFSLALIVLRLPLLLGF